jgi:hypothetical protein
MHDLVQVVVADLDHAAEPGHCLVVDLGYLNLDGFRAR